MSRLAFRYQAIDRKGVKSKGVLRANDRSEAYSQIAAAGLKPVRITATRFASRRLWRASSCSPDRRSGCSGRSAPWASASP